nr:S41 family peptidase [uncultured Psychroserpens sp.]
MQNKINFSIVIALSSIIILFSCNSEVDPCVLTNEMAINEIDHIENLLNEKSPYMNINDSRVSSSLNELIIELNENDSISKKEFSFKLKTVLSKLGDRHSELEYIGNCIENNRYFLPFALAPWKGNEAIALVKEPKLKFSFYLDEYPFLTRINNQSIKDFIHQYDVKNTYAPKFSKQALGIEKLNEFYKIKPELNVGDQMKFTFTSRDFKSDTTLLLSLVDSKNKWRDIDSYLFFDKDDDRMKQLLFRQYDNDIAYIKIPEMYKLSENEDYFQWMKQTMDEVKSSNAFIIDLRNNPGGNRDLIHFFSNYLVAPNTFHVANLARYRGDISDETKKSLNTRRLYPYSHFKDTNALLTIDGFMKNFHPSTKINEVLYSEYYYMLINSESNTDSYYYNKPIYILTNEMTFSAASVFASAFKGIENIKIVGISSDGSSGMPKTYELTNSEIRLSLSHMLSYQKNGALFDGVGTSPDLEIHRSMNQIQGHEDTQLMTLLKTINENHSMKNLNEKE